MKMQEDENKVNKINAEDIISQCEYTVEKAKSVNIAVSQAICLDEHATDTYLPCFSVMDDLLVKIEEELMTLQEILKQVDE